MILESGTHLERSLTDVALELFRRIGGSFRLRSWLLLLMFLLLRMVFRVVNEHLRIGEDFVASVALITFLLARVSAFVELQ